MSILLLSLLLLSIICLAQGQNLYLYVGIPNELDPVMVCETQNTLFADVISEDLTSLWTVAINSNCPTMLVASFNGFSSGNCTYIDFSKPTGAVVFSYGDCRSKVSGILCRQVTGTTTVETAVSTRTFLKKTTTSSLITQTIVDRQVATVSVTRHGGVKTETVTRWKDNDFWFKRAYPPRRCQSGSILLFDYYTTYDRIAYYCQSLFNAHPYAFSIQDSWDVLTASRECGIGNFWVSSVDDGYVGQCQWINANFVHGNITAYAGLESCGDTRRQVACAVHPQSVSTFSSVLSFSPHSLFTVPSSVTTDTLFTITSSLTTTVSTVLVTSHYCTDVVTVNVPRRTKTVTRIM